MSALQSTKSTKKTSWRLTLGTWMFYVPFVLFFGAPILIPLLGFSASAAAALIGGIVVAAEVIWFASIPLLGKEGFKRMESHAFGLLRPKSGPIGKTRHQIGIWMFAIGLFSQIIAGMAVMIAYFIVGANDPGIPIMGLSFELQAISFASIQIASIASMVGSVYVLGADFWNRVSHAVEWGTR